MAWDVLAVALAAGCLFTVALALYGSNAWRRPFAERPLRWWQEPPAPVRLNRPPGAPPLAHRIGRVDGGVQLTLEQIRDAASQVIDGTVLGEENAATGPLGTGAVTLRVIS